MCFRSYSSTLIFETPALTRHSTMFVSLRSVRDISRPHFPMACCRGHRDSVTDMLWLEGAEQLVSCSKDGMLISHVIADGACGIFNKDAFLMNHISLFIGINSSCWCHCSSVTLYPTQLKEWLCLPCLTPCLSPVLRILSRSKNHIPSLSHILLPYFSPYSFSPYRAVLLCVSRFTAYHPIQHMRSSALSWGVKGDIAFVSQRLDRTRIDDL